MDSDPRAYLLAGDKALLELRDGSHRAGTVQVIRKDSVTIAGKVIPWAEVVMVSKEHRAGAGPWFAVAILALALPTTYAVVRFGLRL
jgi:hypothetical protein